MTDPAWCPVERAAFEDGLARLARDCHDPVAGLFGPSSLTWRVHRESFIFLGAAAALLLQVAHPWVAQAITDHSTALGDPLARYYRTFRPVFAMLFGTKDQALAQARAVRTVHERIGGQVSETVGRWPEGARYMANEAHALAWVQATLSHTALSVYERAFAPLSPLEKNQYHEESKRFAALFGVPAAFLARDWDGFAARFAETARSDTLGIGNAGRLVSGYFVGRARGAFGRHLPQGYAALTASLLPHRLAAEFGLPVDAASLHKAEGMWRKLAAFYRRLPNGIRFVGPYQEARRRLEGHAPGLWVGVLNRFWLGRGRLEPLG